MGHDGDMDNPWLFVLTLIGGFAFAAGIMGAGSVFLYVGGVLLLAAFVVGAIQWAIRRA